MENFVFNNELFDRWLTERSFEIMAKTGKEKITDHEMMVLCLKAQTNYFNHIENEFRNDLRKMDKKFDDKFNHLYIVLTWGFGLLLTSQTAMLLKSFLTQN